jgi:hypothetical protein
MRKAYICCLQTEAYGKMSSFSCGFMKCGVEIPGVTGNGAARIPFLGMVPLWEDIEYHIVDTIITISLLDFPFST